MTTIHYMPGATRITTTGSRPDFTCGGCKSRWSGYHMAHCTVCHQTFGSTASFDRHRDRSDTSINTVACRHPSELALHWVEVRRAWCESWSETRVTVTQNDNRNSEPPTDDDGWVIVGYTDGGQQYSPDFNVIDTPPPTITISSIYADPGSFRTYYQPDHGPQQQ